MITQKLPRFVVAKVVSGRPRYYWTLPTYYRRLGCTVHLDHDTKLGTDVPTMLARAAALNAMFDEWDAARRGQPETVPDATGTVDWLFRVYRASNDWKERVSARTAPDHERTIRILCDIVGKSGVRIGARQVKSINPRAADRLYEKVRSTPRRKGAKARPRTAEKVVAIARHAWKVVRRLHPEWFDTDVPNPWEGVAMKRRTKATKPAATRDQVYVFAWGAVERGIPELGAAAVICFEWLQRPENVLAGYVRWSDYRNPSWPGAIQIEHHKTGAKVLHPLEAVLKDQSGESVRTLFYAEAEAILERVPQRGLAMILRSGRGGKDRPWTPMTSHHVVRELREQLGLPATFTLDACRHGGMTELEEAGLTDGQGRALSAHRSKAYEGYAKRTEERALAATMKRHAYKVAQQAEPPAPADEFQNSRLK